MTHPHLLLDTDNVLYVVEGPIPEKPKFYPDDGLTGGQIVEMESAYEEAIASLTKIKVGNPREAMRMLMQGKEGTKRVEQPGVIIHSMWEPEQGVYYPINGRVEIKEEFFKPTKERHQSWTEPIAFLHPIDNGLELNHAVIDEFTKPVKVEPPRAFCKHEYEESNNGNICWKCGHIEGQLVKEVAAGDNEDEEDTMTLDEIIDAASCVDGSEDGVSREDFHKDIINYVRKFLKNNPDGRMSEDNLRKKIAEIIRDGVTYSAQTNGVVIHGAIEEIVKLFKPESAEKETQEELWDAYDRSGFANVKGTREQFTISRNP